MLKWPALKIKNQKITIGQLMLVLATSGFFAASMTMKGGAIFSLSYF
jgi:hypothetical protein